jgi:DNA-binding response OmpR family regulator
MADHTNRYRVLLIDDDADVADLVVAILTDEGYSVSVLVNATHDTIRAAGKGGA